MGSRCICSSTLTLGQLSERSTLSGADLHLLTELPSTLSGLHTYTVSEFSENFVNSPSTLRPRQLSVNFLTSGVRQLSEFSKNSENSKDSENLEFSDNSELSEN